MTGNRKAEPELTVDKAKFDALLRKMIATPPTPLSEVKAKRKRTQGGDTKLSSKKRR